MVRPDGLPRFPWVWMAELRLELRHAGFQTALCGGLQEARGMGDDPNHVCGASLPETCPPMSQSDSLSHAHNEGECGKGRRNVERGGGGEGRVDEGSHGVSWWVTPPHQAPSATPVRDRGISCSVDPTQHAPVDPLAVEALSPAGASFWKEARGQSCTCTLFSHLRVRTPLSPDCMMVPGQLGQVGAWILALGSHTRQMGIISPLTSWLRE